MGDVQEAIRLNRLLRLCSPGAEGGVRWELETDPRSVEILISQMGLGDAKQSRYRSWTMRASDLSQDRCELRFAVKELARRMQLPDAKNMQALKRLVRFLKGSPRCSVVYGRQAEQQVVDVFSDSDWAGCVKTRRSTSSHT